MKRLLLIVLVVDEKGKVVYFVEYNLVYRWIEEFNKKVIYVYINGIGGKFYWIFVWFMGFLVYCNYVILID